VSQDETADGSEDRTDLLYVGEATAATMAEAGIAAADVRAKSVSYRQIVDAGVNPGVATKIRREHSLHWSLDEQGTDLDDRSRTVRGLRDGERDWVAASGIDLADGTDEDSGPDGDWTPRSDGAAGDDGESTLTDGDWAPTGSVPEASAGPGGDWSPSADDGGPTAAETDGSGGAEAAESAWRERSRPDPLTDLASVDEADADRLGEAGVGSVRRLATADPEHVADVLDIEEAVVAEWHAAAVDRLGE